MSLTKKKSDVVSDGAGVRGFFRVQLKEDGRVVGDSGWRENQVTNLGIQDYLVTWLVTGSGGKTVTHMAIGTGGVPASNDTTLSGQVTDGKRAAVSTSIVSSRTAQFTAAFNSSDSFLTATANISNIGLFATSATNLGTLFAGNTFASSAVATNQSINATYQIRIS